MIPENYSGGRSLMTETVEIVCRNCGRKRYAVWTVARLLPKDEEGRPATEVCHECLNDDRVGRGLVRVRTR
jgi:hypothetical protein